LTGVLGDNGQLTFSDRLRLVEGTAIEAAGPDLGRGRFGLIVSRAVLEYVQPIERAFAVMAAALAPGGAMLHKVDLRDHGLFTGTGNHPLTFLTIPTAVYRRISAHTGIPNRRLIDDYIRMATDLDFQCTVLVTHVVGDDAELEPHEAEVPADRLAPAAELIAEIRPSLAREFRDRDDAVLATAGLFLTTHDSAAPAAR
jgi:SAM-dependent methyltransferase